MEHSFDVELAVEYGLVEAILLNNFQYWIEKNKANRKNYYDGSYWTYNTTKAFSELFPYLSQRKIQNALKRLRENGIIKVGNYNENQYDRTLWYAFTKKGECIMQKREMDSAEKGNGLCENVKCTNTDNKHRYIYTDIEEEWNGLPNPIPKIQSIRGTRATALKARIDEYGNDGIINAIRLVDKSSFLKGKNDRGWIITFDWFIKPSNFVKVLEGNYTDKQNKNKLKCKPSFDKDEIAKKIRFNDDYDI